MNSDLIEFAEDLCAWLRFQKQTGIRQLHGSRALKAFLEQSRPGKETGGRLSDGRSPRMQARRKPCSLKHGEKGRIPAESGPAPSASPSAEVPSSIATLDDIRELLGDCTRCGLHRTRKHIVFGHGPQDARLVVVGEAPGRDEDRQGLPFVGASGELLTKMLRAVNISRQEVYIANILKCRPPGNRNPQPDEIRACLPFLERQIELIDPPLILTLGAVAAQTLLQTRSSIQSLRGRFHIYRNAKLITTYHPSFLLRQGGRKQIEFKRKAWHDLQMLEKEYVRFGA